MKWRKLDILDEQQQQQAAEHGIYDNQAHMVKVGILQLVVCILYSVLSMLLY